MERYTVKLTIQGQAGVFAEKYSATVKDAQYLNHWLQTTTMTDPNGPNTMLAKRPEPALFDALPFFPHVMKLLRICATKPTSAFFTGVREVGQENWQDTIQLQVDGSAVQLFGIGRKALVIPEQGEPTDVSKEGSYEAEGRQFEWRSVEVGTFRETLSRLVEMCEDSMSKGDLISTTL